MVQFTPNVQTRGVRVSRARLSKLPADNKFES